MQTSRFSKTIKFMTKMITSHPRLVAGLLVVVTIIAVAVFAPWLAPHDPDKVNYGRYLESPSSEFLLGTDSVGRDLLSRVIFGSRVSLMVGGVAVVIAASVGISMGMVSGYYGGWVDEIIMRITDVFLSFPVIILAIAIVAVLGPGPVNVMIALGLATWTEYARVIRAQVLTLKDREFVEAARALGATDVTIMLRHVLPNSLSPIIVLATLGTGTAIIAESGLSFLGLGVQPPLATWGVILSDGRAFLRQAPFVTTFAGLAIMITVLGLNFLGDGLRDYLDPRLKNR